MINFQDQNLTHESIIRTNTQSLLENIPENAIVETPGDPTIFTLWYIIYAEKQRLDVIPVDSDLFAFDWYRDRLKILYPSLSGLENDDLTRFQELNKQIQPYCFASLATIETETQTNYSLVCLENTTS